MKTTHLLEPLEQRIAPAFSGSALPLSGLNGLNGFKVSGHADFDFTGSAVSSAGDVNGDGLDDVLIGAPYLNDGTTYTGGAYVVFGSATPGAFKLKAADLDGTNGFLVAGAEDEALAGISVSAAGDLNGDGLDDIIIGAPGAGSAPGTEDYGAAYVVYGRTTAFPAKLSVNDLNGQNGFGIYGTDHHQRFGGAVSAAGDVNGDGHDDVIIGASGANGDAMGSGAAYVILGKKGAFSAVTIAPSSASSFGFKIAGISAGDSAGGAVGGGGDVNGDGYDDLIIGASGADSGGTDRGAAYVVFGKSTFNTNVALSGLGGSNGFRLEGVANGDRAGSEVAILGDINADGLDDLGIGAKFADENGSTDNGAAYVLFGHTGASPSIAKLSAATLDGVKGCKFYGSGDGDYAGGAIRAAGDLNGDGRDDLIIGAENASFGQEKRGVAYVVLGRTEPFAASRNLILLQGAEGFSLPGVGNGDDAGDAVSAAGDVNGDGFGDLIIGAPLANEGGDNRGAAYVVYGSLVGLNRAVDISADHKSAVFFDTDGDKVTVKITKGDIANLDFDLIGTSSLTGSLLALHVPTSFAGSDLIITAKPTADGGDGIVNLGFLDAKGVDLGKVCVSGHVEHLVVGNPNAPAPAMKSLTVQSLGEGVLPLHETFGANYVSEIDGKVGSITIKGDLNRANVLVKGDVGKATIGGSIVGGSHSLEGTFRTTSSQHIGTLKIGRDLLAGTGPNTGNVFAGSIGTATVGGSIVGSDDPTSGRFHTGLRLDSLTVAHDVRDASISSGKVGKVIIGGSLLATDDGAGTYVAAGTTIGSVTVKGEILGTEKNAIRIAAGGPLVDAASPVALGSLTVGGSVENTFVTTGRSATNGHSQVGAVKVGGDWVASSIAAGALTAAGNYDLTHFGNDDDALLPGGPVDVAARIASIVIKGEVRGTASGGDHFGFVAQEIGALKIGALNYVLNKAVKEEIALGSTGDFKLHEI